MATRTWLFIAAFIFLSLHWTEAQVGVCYGKLGNNLPCAREVVDLYKSYNIRAMRLYWPDQDTLKEVQGTNIKLMLGVANEDIIRIGCLQSNADEWVRTNVVPYASSIKYIVVGNEIKPWWSEASYMVPAMQNILNALKSNNLGNQIIVSTAIDSGLLQNTYPPSHAEFRNLTYIVPIIDFLTTNDWPLVANIEPYTAYRNDPPHIGLQYVLFTLCEPKFIDDWTKLPYQNLFDALYDAVYVAVWKVAYYNLNSYNKDDVYNSLKQRSNHRNFKNPVTGETGMTSRHSTLHQAHKLEHNKDSRFTTGKEMNKDNEMQCGYPTSGYLGTMENAKIFYTNMLKHVKKGTPLTQGQELQVFLFAMFDENEKTGDVSENYYGLFTPDMQSKYGIQNFCVDE